jgi:cell division septation protein DedD
MEKQDHEEKKLFVELEALYRQVAESEKPEADNKQREDLQSYYQSLQVSADASLEMIKEIYERLISFWGPGQFADSPSVREKSEIKLAEITQAYEEILAFRQKESELQPAEPANKNPEPLDLLTPDEETIPPFRWGKIFLGAAVFVAAGFAVFFWPTFYHFETIPSGNRDYQVRTNRITGNMTYFDGEKWNNPPIPAPQLSPPQPPPSIVSRADPPGLSANQPQPATATNPEATAKSKVPSAGEAASEMQASRPGAAGGYAIQIAAMSNLNAAKELTETQKMSGQAAYMAIIKSRDQGVLHGVYIGRFAKKEEAARYMKEKKIRENFPGCFIQKMS